MRLVECVPNFSEGRNKKSIDAITETIAMVEGVELLDVDPGASTNRTVVTFVGDPEAALEAAFLSIAKAAQLIDMRQHRGAHESGGDSKGRQLHPLPHHHSDDVARLRAERHAEADIVGALRNQVCHNAVDAHGGQDQREQRERSQHGTGEALARQRAIEAVLHSPDFEDRDFGIDSMNLANDG